MQRLGEGAFVKTGAEGVYCAALPKQGLGIAVKCDDGSGRAAEVMLAAMLVRFLPASLDTLVLEQHMVRLRGESRIWTFKSRARKCVPQWHKSRDRRHG